MHVTLAELAGLVAGVVDGDAETLIRGLAPLEEAKPGDLTFVANRRHAPRLDASRASAVLEAFHGSWTRAAGKPASSGSQCFT